jgi:Xaa-Pro aminopeptidase
LPECDQRRRALANRFAELKIDALLVSSPANVRYLTGFTGSNGLLLLTPEKPVFLTDPRYTTQAATEADVKTLTARGPLLPAAAAELKKRKLKRIGFEPGALSYEAWAKLKDELPAPANLRAVGGVIEALRTVKSAEEVLRIRRSAATAAEALARTLKQVKPGLRELDVAAELDYQMRRLGAEGAAFETIVASGARTALPHARPTTAKLEPNQLLLIDMGASREGYASDMTRMAHFGTPGAQAKEMHAAVLEAQRAALDAVRPGRAGGDVDAAARKVLRKYGLERAFVHATGHGLGLEIHELPRIGQKEKGRLEAGMVVTIEPGVYIAGSGGVRIEDTVLVTRTGSEVLTPTPKELVSL